jgi:predicted transposase YbfD/YdcC
MNLINQLKQISDPRSGQGRRYPLWELIMLVLLGSFCGYIGYRPLSAFCQSQGERLRTLLGFPAEWTPPSFSTFRRLLMQVPAESLGVVFDQWCQAFLRPLPSSWLSGDGKSIRCTRTTDGGNYISTATLFTHTSGYVVAFALFENAKTTEISVMRQCIESYQDVADLTYTLDALHCQKETVAQIVRQRQHYLIAVKGNQKHLFATLHSWIETTPPLSVETSTESRHGRTVSRTLSVYPMPPELQQTWHNSQQVITVQRQDSRGAPTGQRLALYITDRDLLASTWQTHLRAHWQIENRLHWVRDVTFQEDTPPRRGGHAPANWAVLNSWLVSLIRRCQFDTIPAGIRAFANQVDTIFLTLLNGFSSG